jgi:hypothetical protein
VKGSFTPAAEEAVTDSPLSNLDPASITDSVGEVASQLLNTATNRIDLQPNRIASSAFSGMSRTDAISGSDSNNLLLSGGGVMGRTSPLIGGLGQGSFSGLPAASFSIGGREISTGGVTDLLQKQALDRLEQLANAQLGINIRETVKDVQNAAITITTIVTTASVDIALELVAQNAKLILQELNNKDAIIAKIIVEIRTLNNLVATVLGGLPTFEQYLKDLIRAYNLIVAADTDLKSIVTTLQKQKKYNARLFKRSYDNLVTARGLILPKGSGPPLRINEFLDSLVTRSTGKEALAAMMAIPGATQKLASLMLQYSKSVLEINGLIIIFLSALDKFIAAFKRNDAVDQATIDHINSAIKQLDALLQDMKVELFPTDGRDKRAGYAPNVTAAAAGWGVRLATVIEWLARNPSVGSSILDLTKDNVLKYNFSVAQLKKLNDRKNGLATLKVSQAQENIIDTAKQIGRLMITANTAAVPTKTKFQISNEFKQANDLMGASLLLSGDIRRALEPFVTAQSAFSRDVAAITGSLTKVFDDIGLKRGSDLLKKADFGNFFQLTPATATYAGAAAAGIGLLMKTVSNSTSVTDQDYGKLSEMKDNFDRVADVDMTESVRSFSAQDSLFAAQITETIKNQSSLASVVKGIAKRFDPESTTESPTDVTLAYASEAIGNKFNFGSA